MKTVPSAAYRVFELEQENAELKKRVADMTAELILLRVASVARPPTRLVATDATALGELPTSAPLVPVAAAVKGYMRATKSSEARKATQVPETVTTAAWPGTRPQVTFGDVTGAYDDGVWYQCRPSTLQDLTKSRAIKRKGYIDWDYETEKSPCTPWNHDDNVTVHSWGEKTVVDWEAEWGEGTVVDWESKEWEDSNAVHLSECAAAAEPDYAMTDNSDSSADSTDGTDSTKSIDSTPEDASWITAEPALANVFSSHDMAMKGLREARDLAFAALWQWARSCDPNLFAVLPRQGPRFLRATYTELRDATNDFRLGREIEFHLRRLVDLRNFVGHPSVLDLKGYGNHLGIAEALCERLRDQPQLRKVRKIRADWRVEAQRTLAKRTSGAGLLGCSQ
jgi:hypothetical protein